MGRLFGTDGIRGIVNQDLTADLAMRVGASLGNILGDNGSKCSQKVLVATDTRLSADMLCFAIASGLSLSGVEVVIIGVATTPAVAYLVKEAGVDAGVMITASHNPYEFNGIKIFGRNGYKLPDDTEDKIEALIKEPSLLLGNSKNVGRITFDRNIIDAYKEHLLRTFSSSGCTLRIAVDCANGSASTVAEDILKQVTSEVICINAFPNGTNINRKCGSTDLASLKAAVLDNGCDLGVAFDGDADRCLCVDENGEEVDGDEILAMCAVDMKSRGLLKNDTVVGTVMTNYGFGRFCNENGIVFLSTKVGDRYVLEEMLKGDLKLGGEQSGHVIFSDYATTGDGILTALQVMSLAERSGRTEKGNAPLSSGAYQRKGKR